MLQRLLDSTTLRQQITWIAGLICLAVVAVTTIGSTILARHQEYRDAERGLEFVARSFADQLDQEMAERLREIRRLAELGPMRDVWRGAPDELRAVLHGLQRTLPAYVWIGFAEPGGRVRVATRRLLEGVDVSERPWFASGLRDASAQDVHEARLLESLLAPNPDGSPFRFVDVAVPVRDGSGATIGVLAAHLSWNWASQLRDEVLATRRPELEERILILDRAGRILLGGELGARPFGDAPRNGSRVREVGGEAVLGAFAATRGRGEYPGLGWTVVVERPLRVAMAPANQLTRLLMGLGFGAAIVGVAAFALFAARISRPIAQLTQALGRIGRDPSLTGIERLHGSREIMQLSAAMRSLLRRIGAAESEAKLAHDAAEAADAAARDAERRTMRLGDDLHAMQLLAETDGLTGLLNRRAFRPFATDAMNYFKRYGRTLCVLMVDIDHFKRINDGFGHAVGDEAIRTVGKVISQALRTTDKVARFGGEEFVVLLREIDLIDAEALAERIRESVRLTTIVHGEARLACTVSIGVSAAHADDVDIDQAIERADRALYAAKSAGRNRVATEEAALEVDMRQAA